MARRPRAKNGEPMRWLEQSLLMQTDDCIIWPFGRFGAGDAEIRIKGRAQYVSRIICEKVYGAAPSEKHQAAHSCGKGRDACVNHRHLRWATNAENQADRIAHGTSNQGSRNGRSQLSDEKVIEIDRRLRRGHRSIDIAADLGINAKNVGNIKCGRNWGWLTGRSR